VSRDLGLFLARVLLGAIFTAHGYPKLFGSPGQQVSPDVERYLGAGFVRFMDRGGVDHFANNLKGLGVPAPRQMAWFVAAVEVAAGPLLLLGWLTRPMAFLLTCILIVAIWRVHGKNGLIAPEGYQFELALLAACLALLGAGPGRWAVDPE
jgi:putative oxidoreductase